MIPDEPSQLEINYIINLVSKGLFQEALDQANKLLKNYPNNSLLLNIAGACNAGLGKLDNAVVLYKKAIESQPDYAKAHYNLAGTFHDMGELEESIQCYKRSIEIESNYAEAHNNLGNVYRQLWQLENAVNAYERAIIINPNYIEALYSLGITLQSLDDNDAIDFFKRVIKLKPDFAEAHHNLGIVLKDNGLLEDAVQSYKKAINLKSNYLEAHNNLGNAYQILGEFNKALKSYKKAISIRSDYPTTHNNLGNTLKDLGRLDEAVESYKRALNINPDFAETYSYLGSVFRDMSKFEDAIKYYKKALEIDPENSDVMNDLGVAYKDCGSFEDAIESYKKALEIDPKNSYLHSNLGVSYKVIGRLDDAIQSYKKAIAINPNDHDYHNNIGIIYSEVGRLDDAIQSYEKAIAINPNYADALNNMAITLTKLNRLEEACQFNDKALKIKPDYSEGFAIQGRIFTELNQLENALSSFEKAHTLNPELAYTLGTILNTKMNLCNWTGLSDKLEELKVKINNKERVIVPFDLLSLIDDPSLQGKTSVIYANDKFLKNDSLAKINFYPNHQKIRIGYFSADFNLHPVARLTAELYETHDKSQFEIHAFSFGPDTNDEMNLRIKKGVDQFHDVKDKSNKEIALLARSLEIDIAVDLGGFTADSRTGVFALSAAPIQISYIGVLSTMGAEYYDYLVAGQGMIPMENQKYYSEKIVYLPSYQVNDSKELLPNIYFSRKDLGLPDEGFIFCCFNNTYKITPQIFDSWARILDNVENSVMMIYISNEIAKKNLIKEITHRGIDSKRLIFTEKLPRAEYLARYRLADLFLDTHPYNAGTTASDALRMGLPILTLNGDSFNSREAASIISAVNLPEMITSTIEEYESLAIELANNPKKYELLKKKLASNLPNAPLFDTEEFTKNLESAYEIMVKKYYQRIDPDHIYLK